MTRREFITLLGGAAAMQNAHIVSFRTDFGGAGCPLLHPVRDCRILAATTPQQRERDAAYR